MLTQKKTKAIMLWDTPVKKVMFRDKQIRPEAKKEFYYDFVSAWSPSQLKLDGWVYSRNNSSSLIVGEEAEWGWEITVNWLHNTLSSGYKFWWTSCLHWIDLSSINKITTVWNYVINSWSRVGSGSNEMTNDVLFSNTFDCGGTINAQTNSGYNGYAIYVWDSSNTNRTKLSSWAYTLTVVYDLVNKTATVNVTGYPDRTLSITDSQINSIRNCGYISVEFDNRWCYCKDIKMTVE